MSYLVIWPGWVGVYRALAGIFLSIFPISSPEGVEIAWRERSSFTRLETRTKESNIYASIREFDYSLVYFTSVRYINECAVKANGGSFETPVVRLESQKGITHFPLHAASTDRANFP